MATLITKNSSTASAVPAAGDLVKGELAVNVTDKKVYTKDNSAAVVKLVGSLGNQEANAVAITGGTINGTTIGATTPSTGAFTTASASSGFTGNLTGNVTGNVSGTAANVTGVVAIANGGTGLSALGTGVQSALGQNVTGSGGIVLATSPSLTTPNLGTPSAAVLTNATGLPLTTGVTGTLGVANGGTGITAFGTGVATALGQNVTGSGGIVLATSPSLTTPNLGTPSAATLTNATGLPISTGVSGLGTGVATALGVATGSAGAFVVNGGALGTPLSGTLTNATGLPLSTGVTGTLATTNGGTGLTSFTANGVVYASSSSALTTGSALTFDGTTLTTTGRIAVSGTNPSIRQTVQNAYLDLCGGTTVGVDPSIQLAGSTTAGDANSVFYNTNNHVFRPSSGASEYMRLTSTGLGIGTSTPAYKLDVANGDAQIYGVRVGRGAGAVSTNTAVGVGGPLASNTSGGNNTAHGNAALGSNTTGSENTATGSAALILNTTGSNNTAVGRSALLSNTTASNNTAVGYQALYTNSTGANNTAVGYLALRQNTGSYNTVLGDQAGYSNTSGEFNVYTGRQTGYTNTTGSYNVAYGTYGLINNTGSYNTAIGHQSLQANTTASGSTAVGYQAAYSATNGNAVTAFGYQAGKNYLNTAENWLSTFIGYAAGLAVNTGIDNTLVGGFAGSSITSGGANTAVGGGALTSDTTGGNNTAIGTNALRYNTTASNNTAVGYQAGYANTTGFGLTISGYQAGVSTTTANANSFYGYQSGNATTGASNTFVGYYSGALVTTGSKNTIIGCYNGNQGGLDIRTASGYIVLSDGDGNPRIIVDGSGRTGFNGLAPYVSYNLSIPNTPGGNAGVRHQASTTGTSYAAEFYTSDNNSRGYISYTTSGTTYSTTSDYRLKHDIQPITGALAKIAALKPVTYKWNSDNSDGEGFIAHELAEVCPQAVTGEKDAVNEDGSIRPQGIDTSFLVATLTAAIQELKAEFDAYKAAHP